MLQKLEPIVQRLIVSFIVIAVLALTLLNAHHPYLSWMVPAVAILMFGLALKEYYNLTRAKGFKPQEIFGIGVSTLYFIGIYLGFSFEFLIIGMLIALQTLIFSVYFYKSEKPLDNSAATLFGLAYVTIPLGCVLQLIYSFPEGPWWAFYLFAVTYLSNAAALFTGKAWGKHKFAAYISPKKTWEGAAGGFITALITSAAFYLFAPIDLTLPAALGMGALLGIGAQFGDLIESLLKRDAGVKDSGFIPGLGGMLDMIDSLIYTAPLLYLYLFANKTL